ncbi:2-succinyl-6-hydroxy-2,4-cyclohexadiene-1-carboxylate synthase [Thaumasiovibrio sp. DFM-14]|uniref:2-succinyl-6-hydroxy-2, 4-cyclohexadiene-1-carboxylate synthase n=1 Tax=Thaumasiovibrio sp. DFM-14 TaxID=3384792 RepID=UPI0039A07C9F
MLFSASYGNPSHPCLVFLHGFLGSGADWMPVVRRLSQHYYCILVDLPGHGQSVAVRVSAQAGFEESHHHLQQLLQARGIQQYVLIGYSLGARIAMFHAVQQPQGLVGLVIEGGHFGLPDVERAARLTHDEKWAVRFTNEPMPTVLADWYQQTVFSHLSMQQRHHLIEQRGQQKGASLAAMMRATSLGRQACLDIPLIQSRLPVHYLVGEWDNKFTQLARSRPFSIGVVEQAGHNTHHEAPAAFCRALMLFLQHIDVKEQ